MGFLPKLLMPAAPVAVLSNRPLIVQRQLFSVKTAITNGRLSPAAGVDCLELAGNVPAPVLALAL